MGHLRGWDCVSASVKEVKEIQKPEAITSTKLRKYIATVSQTAALTELDVDWLARHLGHDIRVHRQFYRLHESTTELAKVSKLLLAVDAGNIEQVKGKSLLDMSKVKEAKQSRNSATSWRPYAAEKSPRKEGGRSFKDFKRRGRDTNRGRPLEQLG